MKIVKWKKKAKKDSKYVVSVVEFYRWLILIKENQVKMDYNTTAKTVRKQLKMNGELKILLTMLNGELKILLTMRNGELKILLTMRNGIKHTEILN